MATLTLAPFFAPEPVFKFLRGGKSSSRALVARLSLRLSRAVARYFTTAFLYYCFTSKLPGTRAATLGLSSSLRPHALVVL